MVDAEFVCRAQHFVPLSLLRYITDLPSSEPPEGIGYVGTDGVKAIQGTVPSGHVCRKSLK
jgi:hypothetical protein